MTWQTAEFGASHEGAVAVVLADGSEPGPVYLDAGSGGGIPATTQWTVYTGRFGAPRAAALRGSCSCGWRGTPCYPIDWAAVGDTPLREADIDTAGPAADWDQHMKDVDARTLPLPADLADLLDMLAERLDNLAFDAPLAALKAVAAVERVTHRISHAAAHNVLTEQSADEASWEEIGRALGLTEKDARSRLTRYAWRR
ncbi:hypothetical protein [Streptomyces sp. NBC_01431]|uniref:hypothetical protein n=1 Tax=Streptomyces sp. NBC_01431 TaxID=2903863 RepID=UPI002E34A03D|nr:hypothetical protein [Streptomyces sp. NBC_01431]